MQFIKKRKEETPTFEKDYLVMLEEAASSLTQGHRWGRYHEGNNGTYYTL